MLAIAATHNRCASDRPAPPALAAVRTYTDALVALLAVTMVPGDSRPPPFPPAQTRLRAERRLPAAAAVSRARAADPAERRLPAARPLRAAAVALPLAHAADSDTSAPTLDASAATTTSAGSLLRCARPPRPAARTAGEFRHSLAGSEPAVGFEAPPNCAVLADSAPPFLAPLRHQFLPVSHSKRLAPTSPR